jgi:hypothetical protein
MAIRLSVEANDPEVEEILTCLQKHDRPVRNQIGLLERTMKWLEASDIDNFRCDPSLPHSSHLLIQSPGLLSAPNAGKQVQRHA